MRIWILMVLTVVIEAGEPVVLVDFENGEPADGWEIRNLGLAEIEVPKGKSPSAGRALRLIGKGKRKRSYRGSIQRPVTTRDWRIFRALSLHVAVDSEAPVEMRIIAIRNPGPAGLLRRFVVKPGDWREVVLPLKDFRESIYDHVCDFSRIDRILIRWDKGSGSVSLDDIRLLPGERGVRSCVPTTKDRLQIGFGPDAGKARAFESDHFVVLTDVPGATKEVVAPLLRRLEQGLVVLRERYGVGGEFDDRVPLYLFRTFDGFRAAVVRIGNHYGAGITAPRAQG